MKKFIIFVALAIACSFAFISCGKKGTCEICGKENVSLKKFTYENESSEVCEDCYKGLEEFSKVADELKKVLD